MHQLLVLFLLALGAYAQENSQCDLCVPLKVYGVPSHDSCFTAIYVFGNSLEDVGNAAFTFPEVDPRYYGITNPGCPKGRLSDGALLVDFLAHGFGLPSTLPFLACPCGTNFAFAGATVLPLEYFEELELQTPVPASFENETEWFLTYERTCPSVFKKSLFIVGGGGNDYTVEVLGGRAPEAIITNTVPLVVQAMVQTVQLLVRHGATKILVLNIPQTSCTPLYLDALVDPEGVDKYGCLISYGRIVTAHNTLLRTILLGLYTHSDISIAIADRESFLYNVLINPLKYGFVDTHDACCGGGGDHNGLVLCTAPNSTVCSKPSSYVYFDYVHFTESFNRQEALAFFLHSNKYIVANRPFSSLYDLYKY